MIICFNNQVKVISISYNFSTYIFVLIKKCIRILNSSLNPSQIISCTEKSIMITLVIT